MKKLSVILCLLLCFALLAACSGGDGGKTAETSNEKPSESSAVSLAGQWRLGSSDLINLKEDGTFEWELGGAVYDYSGTWTNERITIGDPEDNRYYTIADAGRNVMHIRWMKDEKTQAIYRLGSNALIGSWSLLETNGKNSAPSIFGTAGGMYKNDKPFILEFRTDGICSVTYNMMGGFNTSDDYSYGVEGGQLYMFKDGEKIEFKVDGNTLTLTEGSYTMTLEKME